MSRHPQHQPTALKTPHPPLTPLVRLREALTPPTSRYPTRSSLGNSPRIDFRAIAGLRSQQARVRRHSFPGPSSRLPTQPRATLETQPRTPNPPASPTSPPSTEQPVVTAYTESVPDSPSVSDFLTPQRWEEGYKRCPVFRDIVLAPDRQDSVEFPHQLQGRRYRFKFCRLIYMSASMAYGASAPQLCLNSSHTSSTATTTM
ncbi:LOW QUALITY PROTEIN: uncharacterized protein EMH_0098820 [Eimeria mitis]|uniref:Uncharacterized protein n=1 Tax=Eimeria mitis TaxID=44415 RepID=U6KJI4_9EIME|nr:LOW QUALITY PROTEIN: uncharacterized protein EMH_0098820 [Eimeria mitis]CDJ35618.1 hypothetical protein, conserved [Eimeria mitis]